MRKRGTLGSGDGCRTPSSRAYRDVPPGEETVAHTGWSPRCQICGWVSLPTLDSTTRESRFETERQP